MKNPTTKGRVSRVSFPNWTPETITPLALQTQLIAARFVLPLETAAMLATIAFGGHGHG